jgi:hypothetical protein
MAVEDIVTGSLDIGGDAKGALAIPRGMTPKGIPVPIVALATADTVPSPPEARIMVEAASADAGRACIIFTSYLA